MPSSVLDDENGAYVDEYAGATITSNIGAACIQHADPATALAE